MSDQNKISERPAKRPPGSAETTAEATEPAAEQPEQNDLLTINDIYAATQVIDAASRRGAFGASEASSVGAVYDRLIAFLRQAAPHMFEENTDNQEGTNNE